MYRWGGDNCGTDAPSYLEPKSEPRLTPANRQDMRSVKTSKLMIYDQKNMTCKYFIDISKAHSDTIWRNVPGEGYTVLRGTFGSVGDGKLGRSWVAYLLPMFYLLWSFCRRAASCIDGLQLSEKIMPVDGLKGTVLGWVPSAPLRGLVWGLGLQHQAEQAMMFLSGACFLPG